MASLSDFYQTPQQNSIAMIDSLDSSASDASTDAGLQQSRLMRDYSQRQLPALVNGAAASGTFYGGQVGVRADNLKQDVGDQYGDIQRTLNQRMADLRRQGILAATGISL